MISNKKSKIINTILLVTLLWNSTLVGQNQSSSDQGAWYMYFFNGKINDYWGVQGDIQYRNFNLGGDLEQLLIRGGVYYKPKNTNVLLTLGFANITTGTLGDEDATFNENRIYQEALLPQKIGIFHLSHRFRYEQRFVENQDFRTRYRYNLFVNIPLNKKVMETNTLYVALYNEIFINGEKEIGSGRRVSTFDRNRLYGGLGYSFTNSLRAQLGFMNQSLELVGRNQLQISLHHNF